jgi:hypothetical protein
MCNYIMDLAVHYECQPDVMCDLASHCVKIGYY